MTVILITSLIFYTIKCLSTLILVCSSSKCSSSKCSSSRCSSSKCSSLKCSSWKCFFSKCSSWKCSSSQCSSSAIFSYTHTWPHSCEHTERWSYLGSLVSGYSQNLMNMICRQWMWSVKFVLLVGNEYSVCEIRLSKSESMRRYQIAWDSRQMRETWQVCNQH